MTRYYDEKNRAQADRVAREDAMQKARGMLEGGV